MINPAEGGDFHLAKTGDFGVAVDKPSFGPTTGERAALEQSVGTLDVILVRRGPVWRPLGRNKLNRDILVTTATSCRTRVFAGQSVITGPDRRSMTGASRAAETDLTRLRCIYRPDERLEHTTWTLVLSKSARGSTRGNEQDQGTDRRSGPMRVGTRHRWSGRWIGSGSHRSSGDGRRDGSWGIWGSGRGGPPELWGLRPHAGPSRVATGPQRAASVPPFTRPH